MALFSSNSNSEPEKNEKNEKNGRPEAAPKPQFASPHPLPTPATAPAPAAAAAPTPKPEPAPERKESSGCAFLDRSAKVNGKLNFDGAAQIDGHVDGEITAKDLTIGETAVITATITAASVIVAGTVKGEITASQRIEIRPTAKVSGEISTPKLAILEGAIFDGRCAMQSDGARDDRDFAARRKEKEKNAAQATQADSHAASL